MLPDDRPPRRPGAQPGNRNARKHGVYSSDPPSLTELTPELRRRIKDAVQRNDLTELRRVARLLKHLGDRQAATSIQDLARVLRTQQVRSARTIEDARDHDTDPITAAMRAGEARVALIQELADLDRLDAPFDPFPDETR